MLTLILCVTCDLSKAESYKKSEEVVEERSDHHHHLQIQNDLMLLDL